MKISKRLREKRNRIIEILKIIDENVDIIIVEGKHDREVLEKLGCKSQIIVIGDAHKPLFMLIEEIEREHTNSRIAILTDFDDEGEKLNKKMEKIFEGRRVTIERTLKKKLRKVMLEDNRRRIEEIMGIIEEEI